MQCGVSVQCGYLWASSMFHMVISKKKIVDSTKTFKSFVHGDIEE